MEGDADERLTIRQVADELGVDKSTVHKWIKARKLAAEEEPFGYFGKRQYVRRSELTRFVNENPRPT